MTSDRPTLFQGLLDEAFEHFAQAMPTVIWASPPAGNVGEPTGRYEIPFSWPCRVVNSAEELGPAVAELLATGPVLLLPPWGRRLTGQGVQRGRNEHEIALLDCFPADPDSLLAVLMPASTLTSQQARSVRENSQHAGDLSSCSTLRVSCQAFIRRSWSPRRSCVPGRLARSRCGSFRYRHARTTRRSLRTSGVYSSEAADAGSLATSYGTHLRLTTAWRSNGMIQRWPPGEQSCLCSALR